MQLAPLLLESDSNQPSMCVCARGRMSVQYQFTSIATFKYKTGEQNHWHMQNKEKKPTQSLYKYPGTFVQLISDFKTV